MSELAADRDDHPLRGEVRLLLQVAMVVFVGADGVADLVVGRVLQGIATGSLASTVGAALIDIDRARGTIVSSVGPMVGTATGGVLSGLLVAFAPAPTTTVFVVLAVLFAAQVAAVWRMAETASRRPGALASMKPQTSRSENGVSRALSILR